MPRLRRQLSALHDLRDAGSCPLRRASGRCPQEPILSPCCLGRGATYSQYAPVAGWTKRRYRQLNERDVSPRPKLPADAARGCDHQSILQTKFVLSLEFCLASQGDSNPRYRRERAMLHKVVSCSLEDGSDRNLTGG